MFLTSILKIYRICLVALKEVIKEAQAYENSHIKSWKADGRKVVGYICVATPIEVLEAGGILPYRIRALGNPETELADAYLSRFNCSFCRSCLQLGLKGTFDFLDGMIGSNGCDHLRGMMENWRYARGFKFYHYVKVPHFTDPDSLKFFQEEVELYKKAVEEHFDLTISDESLWQVINRQERVREKLRVIYQLREQDPPSLYGWEVLSIYLFVSSVPSELAEDVLDQIIDERKDFKIESGRARILFAGSATDEINFIKEIEELGALVVSDAFCYGTRAFWAKSSKEQSSNPCDELARIYLDGLLCPRMFDQFPKRKDFILKAVERAKVDGVVLVHNKFCDVHGVDNVQLRLALEKEGIPTLQLEKEYTARADIGRFKTRIQAFLEKLGK